MTEIQRAIGQVRHDLHRGRPRLLAAVEAVLATAVKWEGEAAGMERAADLDDPEIWNEHAREVREVISRALLGEGE